MVDDKFYIWFVNIYFKSYSSIYDMCFFRFLVFYILLFGIDIYICMEEDSIYISSF